MEPSRRRLCTAAVPLLATGVFLRPALADPRVERASRQLMGTRVDIVVQERRPGRAAPAVAAAFEEMGRLERLMSRYRSDSQVATLQLAAGREPLAVAPEMLAVLKMAQQVSRRTEGAFDVTVGAFSGWSFEPTTPGHLPSASELAAQRRFVGYQDLVIDEGNAQAFLRRGGMKLDLGGIAKLPILQAGLQVRRRHGVHDVMLNGGGDVLVSGQLQGRDWRIGLRDPRRPDRLVGVVALGEGFVASSGDYERCFARNGRRYHHILDPRTGLPSRGVHGVTLISRKLEAVNGLGAAIMVAGAAAGRRWLAAQADVDALIVEADAPPWLSAGMRQRLA